MARVCLTCFHDVNRHGELGCRALDNYSSCDCVAAPIDLIAAERDALLAKFEALVDQWPVGDNGQDYRAAVTQCAAAIRDLIKEARA